MGKATGIGSQFRGKVGNVIGYLTKNRAGRYEQTVKGYQPVVANPQSYAQALARVPVGPVQRVCSALLPLIQRGWEGTAYGDAAKNEFLSYNLKYFRGPFMPKGTVSVPPGPMLITKGSLRSVPVTGFEGDSDAELVSFKLYVPLNFSPSTYGELSEALLYWNEWLVAGEQLTFVFVVRSEDQYMYLYQSMFLDSTNTRALDGVFVGVTNESHDLQFVADEAQLGGYFDAACCIRSQAYGESSFRRSTAFLSCNPLAELYNDNAAVAAAVASYRDGEDSEDWEDDPTPEYQQLAYLCMVDVTQDMCLYASWAAVEGTQCLGYVTKGGDIGIFYLYAGSANSNCLIDGKGKVITITSGGSTWALRYNGSYQPARVYSSIYGTM